MHQFGNMFAKKQPTDHEIKNQTRKSRSSAGRSTFKSKRPTSNPLILAVRAKIRRGFAIRDVNAIAKVTGL